MGILTTLLRKELLDAVRDKRSVMAGLYYALGTPLIVCALFFVLIGQLTSPTDLNITIKNPQYAPDLIRYLSNQGIVHAPADSKAHKNITLTISEQYPQQMQQAQQAEVLLQADRSDEKLQQSIRRLEQQLSAYSSEIASLRLIARGIDPRVVQPLKINMEDQATAVSRGGFILGLAIFTMIYAVFISGMNLAIDTSAGERERHSLALLLSHPILPRQLVLAKILAVTVFAMLGLALILLISKFAYTLVPWQELGFNISITPTFMLLMLLIGFPVALMAASLQIFVSFMAKTFKEAQSYLTLVLILPMGIAMMASYQIAPDLLQWLPVSGQQQALMAFVKGQAIPLFPLLIASVITLLMALLMALALEKMLKSEKIIFGL
ncbi:transporter [Shewanella sp. NFH-SH190041]|uniref:ABC transporter permease n=1 Tax=Shewanella sp. NFH-SH190041 TaxID=2950245 RepID=UPI0021C27C57|nr:ABC transporter permease [Shewanella sp. NFH-SH190041]BDM62676.1 transporter [Shewanella sp. NFH-SH190041]